MVIKMTFTISSRYSLNSGYSIPCVGYGTWQLLDDTAVCVKNALQIGYRHIDTATDYQNEASVGEGIRTSGVAREDIFVTTKCWVSERGYEKAIAAAEKSLATLGLDYLDLYLIHWPCVARNHDDWKEVNLSTWQGFEAMVRAGKIRSIGVSNFLPHHLEALTEHAEIVPAVNQIEFHPGYSQLDTVKWCQKHGIIVEAWSPFGSGASLKDEFLNSLSKKYGKTVPQICIRYALQHGVIPIPRSKSVEHIRNNIDVFDFAISDADMAAIDAMPQASCFGMNPDDAPCG